MIHQLITSWTVPEMTIQLTSSKRHLMDELMLGSAMLSNRLSRQKLQVLVPAYSQSFTGGEDLWGMVDGEPELPTPTDVPVPTPRDVPAPSPIDVPPPTPHDVPPPKPDRRDDTDPKPRPIP